MSVNYNWLAEDREELESILHLQLQSCILHVEMIFYPTRGIYKVQGSVSHLGPTRQDNGGAGD